MFKLIFSMATSNLKKNHSLYLPYALTTIMVTMILYITHALSAMPELSTLRGGGAIAQTLGFGVIVVQLVALLTILYANAFVTKNRLKEYGLYSILGLDRKNIQLLSGQRGARDCAWNRVPPLLVCRFIEAHSNSNRHRVFDATRERRFCTHFNGVYFRGCLLLKCDKDVHEPSVRNAL